MRGFEVRSLLWVAGLCSAGAAQADFVGNLGSMLGATGVRRRKSAAASSTSVET